MNSMFGFEILNIKKNIGGERRRNPETVSKEVIDKFIKKNEKEYEIYNLAVEKFKKMKISG